jgi:hypothetical protein
MDNRNTTNKEIFNFYDFYTFVTCFIEDISY